MGGLPAVGQILTRYLPITGNWIYEQLRRLTRHRAVVITRATENLASFPVSAVHSLADQPALGRAWNRAAGAARGYMPFQLNAARAERVQLLHAHFGPAGARAVPLAKALSVPLVTSFYGYDLGRHRAGREGLRRKYAALFRSGAAFVVEGPVAAERLLALGCPPERVIVHRLGVDLERLPYRLRSRCQGDPLRVLMAARFTEKKGLEYGLEAVCVAIESGARLTVTIVGGPGPTAEDRAIERRLHGIVTRHVVADAVRFTGPVDHDEFRRLLYEHHVFLQPSVEASTGDCEGGLPIALIEAAASGMPLIGTWHSDIPDLVRGGETGWLCEERDVHGLVDALAEAAAPGGRLTELGAGARRRVEETFDLRRGSLDDVYQRVLRA